MNWLEGDPRHMCLNTLSAQIWSGFIVNGEKWTEKIWTHLPFQKTLNF